MKDLRSAENPAPAPVAAKKKRFLIALPGLCLLVLGSLIFRDFLFGNSVLLYKDIGSDSLNDYYPCFVHLSDYIREQGFPSWSFYVGMGQDLYYLAGYLILQPVTWLPRELIAPALVYQHLAKLLIAGLLFFRFLRLRGLGWPASLLGSMVLAGSGYMCMGSCWYTLADEVVCFTALLLATETALKLRNWAVLTLAVALAGFLGSFHLYLCALFLLFYVPARLYARAGWQPRPIFRISLRLAGAAFLGVGLGAIFTLPHLYALLNSPRGSGTTSFVATLTSFPLFGLESRLHYITAALRPFANDALGTGDEFKGWINYLEAPITYCGLLCLVLLPQVFIGAPRRHRVIYALFVAGIVIPTVFPWFRYLFWSFQGDYYRTYSLFSVLGLISLGMIVFSRFIQGRALNLWVLLATALALLGILYLPIGELQSRLKPDLKLPATILLISYSALLAAGQLMKRQTVVAWIVLGLAALELIRFDHITVSNRNSLTKQELKERTGYNDETVDAVRDIMASDNGFFRITKLRSSGPSVWISLNDALIFGFYGTSSYSSFNNLNYTNFLIGVDAMAPDSEADTRWSVGLLGSPIASMFAGEKYALVPDPARFQTAVQYEFVKRYGNDHLFRNKLFLPLGLTFHQYLPEEEFRRLPGDQRQEVLLGFVVLADKETAGKHGIAPVTIPELQQQMKLTTLPAIVAQRREGALSLTSFRQTRIEGTVRVDQKSVLVLQTPFDRGWRALQDGKPAPVLKADVGLLGVVLDAGEHKVDLSYSTPLLRLGLLLTLASGLILGAMWWRWPRFRLPG
ncbi:MAG TPA: YfhO family protein [Chthoniobacterales bacterium]|nr:YfhO family protein [Chthoniobacterales bacterium]